MLYNDLETIPDASYRCLLVLHLAKYAISSVRCSIDS